jgi:hypothetical protein
MNRKQFDDKFEELLSQANESIRKRAKEVIKSGALDLDAAADNFDLPRVVMIDSLIDAAASQKHYIGRGENLRILANLKHF